MNGPSLAEQRDALESAGFLIFDPQIPDQVIEAVKRDIAVVRAAGRPRPRFAAVRGIVDRPSGVLVYGDRVQDAWRVSEDIRSIAFAPAVMSLLRDLYGRQPVPFQTLNFHVGTQQMPHSDTIHFNSIPRGFMCGVWIALEDMDEDNGPLVYYPGSHKLPEYTMRDLNARASRSSYLDYEQFIQQVIAREQLEPAYATIRKGQAAIWAANLLHGGSAIRDAARSRHSQVTHYNFKGCLYATPILGGYSPLAVLRATIWRQLTRVR